MRFAPRAPSALTASGHRRRSFVLFVSAMRVLALVVAMSCTGVLHAADDLAAALSGYAHVDEDCSSSDDQSHDCPPGCPSCHGASGFVRALPPNVGHSVELLSPPADDVMPWFVELRAPRLSHRSTVYRPPRSLRLPS